MNERIKGVVGYNPSQFTVRILLMKTIGKNLLTPKKLKALSTLSAALEIKYSVLFV